MSDLVPAFGPSPNLVLLCGKAPGIEELSAGRPHVGRNGRETKLYCDRHSLSLYSWRLTNLCREYVPPDQRLTPSQVSYWESDILSEISHTCPRLIVAVGSDAVRFFLGSSASLKTVHGIPHRPGALDPSISYRAPVDCCILPVMQPAAGFHSSDARALINWDFSQVARVLDLIRRGDVIDYRVDRYAGKEIYRDVTGGELARILHRHHPPLIAIDTEGTPADGFSLQVCFEAGTSYLLRCDQPDFYLGISAIQSCADAGSIITGHNIGMYDLEMFRSFKPALDLFDAHVHDTLFDAFLFCLEPLGLKPNSWRHLGMKMKSHNETVGALGKELQVEYLYRALEHTKFWPKPDPIFTVENDGQISITKPNTIASRIKKILADIEAETAESGSGSEDGDEDKRNNDDDDDDDKESDDVEGKIAGVDPYKRWRMVKRDIPDTVAKLESEIGRMPSGTMRKLWQRDPDSALIYSCTDADASFRLYPYSIERLSREGKTHLAEIYSRNMHVFSEMQENGMPLLKSKLVALQSKLSDAMLEIVNEISHLYNDGQPYNPRSNPQTARLFTRWGLRGTKKTKAKKMSYGKKSVEHLKFVDDSMSEGEKFRRNLVALRLKWIEHQHTRDMFCKPTLALLPDDSDGDECSARGQLLPWGTHTGRMAMKRPNLLAQPKHSIYGQWIRDCYVAPEGYVFIECDLSAIEVCMIADHSNDPDLIRILKSGVKFHRETAVRLFNIPAEQVTDTQYYVAKRTIFLTFYGGTGQGLREQLWMQGLTQFDDDMCQDLIDGVKYRAYPAIGKYEKTVERELRKNGKISDWGGMERHLPGIWSEDRQVSQEAIRHGVSQKIQGGAQRMIQEAISYLKDKVRELRDEYGIDVRWRLTVHDSLLLTCPERAVEIVREVIEEGLINHCGIKLKVPVKAESKTAKSWGGL